MRLGGIKASDLIKLLQVAITKNGDHEVFHGGSDYPEGVRSVSYRNGKDDGYYPERCFVL